MKYIYFILLALITIPALSQTTLYVTNRPGDADFTICYTESRNLADVEINVVSGRGRLHSINNSVLFTKRRHLADRSVYVTYCRADVIKVYMHRQIKFNMTEDNRNAFKRLIINNVSGYN